MGITLNVVYKGEGSSAKAFAEEMEKSGTAGEVRREDGCIEYAYFLPLSDDGCVLLLERWRDQAAIDAHKSSPAMKKIAGLKERFGVSTEIRKYHCCEG